jgi:hypothetical protein
VTLALIDVAIKAKSSAALGVTPGEPVRKFRPRHCAAS